MAGMTNARRQITDDLEAAGLVVEDHVPENVVPPLVFIRPASPMLEESDTLDSTEFVYRIGLLIVAENQPNAEAIASLEEVVEQVIYHLGDWSIETIEQPFMAQAGGNEFPAVQVVISTQITIEGGN